MARFQLQTILLALLLALASAFDLTQHNESNPSVDKRWFSIPLDGEAPLDHPYAWPPCEGGMRPVRYCFRDAAAYRELHMAFFGGIAKWFPAIKQSSLTFDPDIACGQVQQGRCLCNVVGVAVDTLHIALAQESQTAATRGYIVASQQHTHYNPPNYLNFHQRRTNRRNPNVEDREDKKRALTMAHELGHVIGLEHENQRPDAHNYVFFDCGALTDFEETRQRMNNINDEPKFQPGMTDWQKMQMVCTDLELAAKYFRQAMSYIPYPYSGTSHWKMSVPFDYKSIMIFSSMAGHSYAAKQFGRYPILKWDQDNPQVPMERIYRGGCPLNDKASISDLDIQRVEQLYPIMMQGAWGFDPPDPEQQGQPRMRSRNTATSNAKQPSYRIVVSDVVTTTIRPAPTDFPTSFDDPKANMLASQYARACNGSNFCDEPQEVWLEYPPGS